MVKLYSSHTDPSTLSILIASLSVGIPKLDCVITTSLPRKVFSDNAEAFHITLPFLNIDKRSNISSTNAILLYLSSLQEKLQLVTGVDTMEFLDLTSQTDDATFIEILASHIETDKYLEKKDNWTLADVAVYPRLKFLNEKGLLNDHENLVQYIQFVSKDKFFHEGEVRFKGLLNEAIIQSVSQLNTGSFWELTNEEQASALQIVISHYKDQIPFIEKKDQEKRRTVENASENEISKGASTDIEAYKKAIAIYEQSLNALKKL